jgi:hypothetical protein
VGARAYEKNEESPDLVRFSRCEDPEEQKDEPKPPATAESGVAKDAHAKWSGA